MIVTAHWCQSRAAIAAGQPNLQRAQIKAMIREWDRQYPGRIDNMFTAMGSIVPSHMMDRSLYPFTTIKATGAPVKGGDIAFDEDEGCGDSPGAPSLPGEARITNLSSLHGHMPSFELGRLEGVVDRRSRTPRAS